MLEPGTRWNFIEEPLPNGRCETAGTHIDYRDDAGFAADGELVGGVPHHVGRKFHREATKEDPVCTAG